MSFMLYGTIHYTAQMCPMSSKSIPRCIILYFQSFQSVLLYFYCNCQLSQSRRIKNEISLSNLTIIKSKAIVDTDSQYTTHLALQLLLYLDLDLSLYKCRHVYAKVSMYRMDHQSHHVQVVCLEWPQQLKLPKITPTFHNDESTPPFPRRQSSGRDIY